MKSSGIGGQAVLEGVMMKNKEKYAVAVRKPDKKIAVEVSEYRAIGDRIPLLKLPLIRGVVVFVESLVIGMKTLTYSADLLEDEETTKEDAVSKTEQENKESDRTEIKQTKIKEENAEKEIDNAGQSKETLKKPTQTDKKVQAVTHEEKDGLKKPQTAAMIGTVVISILLAVAIFMLLPYFISQLLNKTIHSQSILTLIEGGLRILLFVGYVAAISQIQDIKRVFMYHGAEHKTINCLEQGLELNVTNVRRQKKYHKRCGTSFLLIVMFVSVILFMFIRVTSPVLRFALRILLIPVIAGISYELIRAAGSSEDSVAEIKNASGSAWIKFLKILKYGIVSIFSRPGMWLQSLTTKEPDDSMIEVAIASVDAVFDWKAYLINEGAKQSKLEQEQKKEAALQRTKERARSQRKTSKMDGLENTADVSRQTSLHDKAESDQLDKTKNRNESFQRSERLKRKEESDQIRHTVQKEEFNQTELPDKIKNKYSDKSAGTDRVRHPGGKKQLTGQRNTSKIRSSSVTEEDELLENELERLNQILQASAANQTEQENSEHLEIEPEESFEQEAAAMEEDQIPINEKEQSLEKKNSLEKLETEDEEEDEVLKALDKYFVYEAEPEKEDPKKGTIRF